MCEQFRQPPQFRKCDMSDVDLELRILTGNHAGASTPVESDLVIGADPSCDIVLTDTGIAPRHARVRLTDQNWSVTRYDTATDPADDGTEVEHFPPGEQFALARVLISIDAANAPWGAINTTGWEANEQSEAALQEFPKLDVANVSDSVDTNSTGQAGWAIPPDQYHAPGRTPKERSLRLGVAALIFIAIALTLRGLFETGSFSPPDSTISEAPSVAQRPHETSVAGALLNPHLLAVERILRQEFSTLELSAQAQTSGSILVTGFVSNEEDYLSVATALSRISPRPALRITNDSETHALISQWKTQQSLSGIQLVYSGKGHLHASGTLRDKDALDDIVQRVKNEFPHLVSFTQNVVLFPEAVQRLEARIKAAGFGKVESAWRGEQLSLLFSSVPAQRLGALESILKGFNREHRGVIPFKVDVRLAPQPSAIAPPSSRSMAFNGGAPLSATDLPFKVRSVIGGNFPYLITDGGFRLLPGGTLEDFRLLSIEPRELIFESLRSGRILSMTR